MKKTIKWVVILGLLAVISYGLYTFANPAAPDAANKNANAVTFEVTQEDLVRNIEVKGKSSYETETIVYAPFNAKVKQWTVKDAQQVSKGDTLFQLDPTELEHEIAQTEAELKKKKLEEQLVKFQATVNSETGMMGMTEDEVKKQFVQKETARLQQELGSVSRDIQLQEMAEKRKKIAAARFSSPATGIFLYDEASKLPQVVQENARIGKIVDTKKLQLVSLVGEQDIFSIKVGMPVKVKINAMKEVPLKGKVLKVSKFAKSGTDQPSTTSNQAVQFEVIISLEANQNLIAGLSLTGQVEAARKPNVIVAPTVAIMKQQDKAYVQVQKADGQVERRDIKIGMETPDKTEIIEGLKPGETVILQ
ncbi:efflux RND transporter periplasmic adaptor subunit [Paenibacillus taiwanensis]|uniref:efflux RND transporter periplasmic adaptor subunit n=1 Tax=Paenibacillus taiwanensis TaxID=401638 RepID=UPI0003FB2172|nr:efflux RND transporter periplasmic adaptor subunit [Paenibacillus taiwanensis]